MINPFKVWRIYRNYIKHLNEENKLKAHLYDKLKELGFDVSCDKNPTNSVGWAIKFAQRYKIDLHGKSLMEVCSAIEKENWEKPINPEVNQFDYGVFSMRPIEEITSIFAYGNTIEEAVCKCLINARVAGVI